MSITDRIDYKKILHIDLTNAVCETKVVGGMSKYLGGLLTSYRLLEDFYDLNPVILSTGLLNGIFPFISKANLLFIHDQSLVEKFGGGSIGVKMNFAGIDAIVITGHTDVFYEVVIIDDEVIMRSVSDQDFIKIEHDIKFTAINVQSKDYFDFGADIVLENFMGGGLKIRIDSSQDIVVGDNYDYKKIYNEILKSYKLLDVEPRNNPSCFGCPIGCDFSNLGEDSLNISVLPRTLIACGYSANIYKSIPTVFRCFESIGYKITHSQLEKLPNIYVEIKSKLNQKL